MYTTLINSSETQLHVDKWYVCDLVYIIGKSPWLQPKLL